MNYSELIAKRLSKLTNISEADIIASFEEPKNESFGDIAFPCFILAKERKQSPLAIAAELAKEFDEDTHIQVKALGPYLNFTIVDPTYTLNIISDILKTDKLIKANQEAKTVLVESPGPNTNKPLHLGHLRNILLGQSITKMLLAIGKDAHIVNVVNDRGIHIAKSMLAYKKWGENKNPQDFNMKPDHFVGHWYVRFAQEAAKSEDAKNQLEAEAKELLIAWENEDAQTIALWKKMNDWVYEGFEKTYKSLDFSIEKNYFESNTYKGGRDIIMDGLDKGLFYKDKSGAIMVDLTDKKLDKKILLRSDGTSVYITQDLNMARLREEDYHFDEMIYVVGNEQEYHFKVLFELFKMLKWSFGGKCMHFSYGMIELPEGKMKSREGNVIDTDELVEQTINLAKHAVKERYKDLSQEEINSRAHMIGMAAIRFFFLKQDPARNFVFDPKASLAFEGETGPYVQYTYARICSILRKADTKPELKTISSPEDKSIAKLLSQFQEKVQTAALELKPHLLCNYLLTLCQAFNSYYAKNTIIQDDKEIQSWRLALISAVSKTIKEGLALLSIDAPERM